MLCHSGCMTSTWTPQRCCSTVVKGRELLSPYPCPHPHPRAAMWSRSGRGVSLNVFASVCARILRSVSFGACAAH